MLINKTMEHITKYYIIIYRRIIDPLNDFWVADLLCYYSLHSSDLPV
jgi:hypothetical protein